MPSRYETFSSTDEYAKDYQVMRHDLEMQDAASERAYRSAAVNFGLELDGPPIVRTAEEIAQWERDNADAAEWAARRTPRKPMAKACACGLCTRRAPKEVA